MGKRSLSHHGRLSLGLSLGLGRELSVSLQLRVVLGHGRSHSINDCLGLQNKFVSIKMKKSLIETTNFVHNTSREESRDICRRLNECADRHRSHSRSLEVSLGSSGNIGLCIDHSQGLRFLNGLRLLREELN